MTGKRKRRHVVHRTAITLGICGLAVLAFLPSGAATAARPADRNVVAPDLSTVANVKTYLRSLGVDPRGVVIQRGARNYAGPNCPGTAWNCTTSTRVIQISGAQSGSSDDLNKFVCRRDRGSGSETKSPSPPLQSCVIVQPGGSRNDATCEIRRVGTTGTFSQTCVIVQGGSQNSAVARLTAALGTSTGEQDVVQRIEIKQTGGATSNTLEASQAALLGALKISGGAATAKQDFHQIVCANQIATGGGSNTASVLQNGSSGVQFANSGAATIDQNTESLELDCNPSGGAGPFADISGSHADGLSCALEGGSGSPKTGANSCARVQQESVSGRNKIDRQTQTNLLAASIVGAPSASIHQGSTNGGTESTQDQQSTGISSIVDSQRTDQVAAVRNIAGAVTVDQLEDPRCCAAGHQIGNAGNTWSLAQNLSQRVQVNGVVVDPGTSSANIEQDGAAFGNCSTTGTCGVTQTVSTNTDSQTTTCSGASCDIGTTCEESGGEGDGCSSGGPAPPNLDSVAECVDGNPPNSTEGVTQSNMTVNNFSGQHVRIFWLDYEGDLVLYNDLDAGQSYLQGTWLTHPWVAIDDEGSCTSYFLVEATTETWTVGD